MKLAILKNEDPFDHMSWVKACERYPNNINYKVIDLTIESWLEDISNYDPDILLLKPSGKTARFRALYQERLDILVSQMNFATYPSIDEVKIYENKRYLSYWLKVNEIPHPATRVFYNKPEALKVLKNTQLPLVGKMNVGSSGKGVRILNSNKEVMDYLDLAFSSGISSRTGPKLGQGSIVKRVFKKLVHPGEFMNKLRTYADIANDKQTGFVIIQEYIEHNYEWRVVRIGDSFFAHKRLVKNGKASGTLLKEYCRPPELLLDYVKEITDRHGFNCVALDLFESDNNIFLVNEIQCIFGQSDPNLMIIDGIPGRYLATEKGWLFEHGSFNSNSSYDLRLQTVMETLI